MQQAIGGEHGGQGCLSGGGEIGPQIRAFDWASHPLGPVCDWPESLRTAVSICINSRFPMVLWWGPELHVIYNDAYRPSLGTSKLPALGKPGAEVWPEIWHIIGPMLQGVLRTGEATWADDMLLAMDRHDFLEETYWTYSYSPIQGEDGHIAGVFTAVSENTLRVVGERRLQTLRELAAQTLKAQSPRESCFAAASTLRGNPADVPFALLYLADQQTHLLHLYGNTLGTGVLPEVLMHLPLDPGAGAPIALAEVVSTGERRVLEGLPPALSVANAAVWPEAPRQAVALALRSAGHDRVMGVLVAGVNPGRPLDEEYISFFELAAGQVASAIANAGAYEEEKKRAEALAELDRAKTIFFSNISHEFRTPLTLMLGPVQDLIDAPEEELGTGAREQLEVVHRNGLRLLKLVNSMLEFSRIEAGRVQAHFQSTQLERYTSELASVFRAAIERAGLEYRVECDPLPEPVYVDPDMWEKIVLNLLSNALKFTLEGEIVLRLEAGEAGAQLTVRDTGVGIEEPELPLVFDRFHRAERSAGRTHEGTGIGLALAQELVRLHGGTIAVESTPGHGSTFTVVLPFGSAHLDPLRIQPHASSGELSHADAFVQEALRWLPASTGAGDAPAPSEELGHGSHSFDHGASKPRIVWADDNADMREYVSRLLAGRFHVEAVADGQAALEACRREMPDLLLSDVMMPRLDGFGLLQAVREDEQLRELPVILLSARAGEEARIEGITAGADDYLIKPFSARELLARVDSQLRMARVRREAEAALRASEERYRAIVESQVEMVCRFFVNGAITFVNGAYARARGTTPEALATANFWEFIEESDRPAVRAMLDGLSPDAPEVRIENRFETTEGIRWTLWTNRAISFDGEGCAVEVQSSGIDITDQKLAQQALLESETRFKTMADTAPAMLWMTDEQHRCTFLSRGWHEFTGQTEQEGLGLGWLQAVHPEDREQATQTFLQSAQQRAPFELDYRLRRGDGEFRWAIDTAHPRFLENGEFAGYIGSVIDIHLRRLAEESLQREHEALEERVRERTQELQLRAEQLGRMASELTITEQRERQRIAQLLHDHLQQLLVVAKIQLETMWSGEDTDERRDPLREIAKLMDEAIGASRSLTVELAPPILHEAGLAAGLRWLARRMKEKHQLEVDVRADDRASAMREDLKILLFQSVRELLFNVVKHAHAPRASVTLELAEENLLRLCVADYGEGFDPQAVLNLTADRETGYGLFSIRERIRFLGGELTIDSAPGAGARLTIVAPMKLAASSADALVEADGRKSRATTAHEPDTAQPALPGRIRVLLVDDHDIVRQGVRSFLSSQPDLEVVGEAADGEQAVEKAHQLLPDLILMDFSMPRMNGVEATRRIKSELPGIKIIGLSMYDASDQAAAMLSAGASAYRTKSGDTRELLETIRSLALGEELTAT